MTKLRMNVETFAYKYCEKGHLNYSHGATADAKHCRRCGAEFVTRCEDCGRALPATFSSPVFFGSGNPANLPSRPSHCEHCGAAYPWTQHDQQLAAVAGSADPVMLVRQICSHFHLVVRQLRERHDNRKSLDVADEFDVQDLLHALLRIHFDDIRAEECTPSYAGGSSRIDFLLKDQSIGLEVKMTRKGLKDKGVGDQLTEDIARYRRHPECKTLVCFVYDPDGRISNAHGLASDLSKNADDFQVIVIIVPKGI